MQSDQTLIQTKSIAIIATIAAVAIIATLVITLNRSSEGNNVNNLANAATVNSTGLMPSENRTFWIDTIHLDGSANVNGDNKHPPEAFPVNATYPRGGGFVLTP